MSALTRDCIAVFADPDHEKVMDFADTMVKEGWTLNGFQWNENNVVATLTKAPKKGRRPRKTSGLEQS